MRRKSFLILSLFSLLLCFLYVRFYLLEVRASNGYPVHNVNTGIGYATIQEAINADETLDGHTILVDSGIYFEHVIINKSISLQGENGNMPIVDGSGAGTIITIITDNVIVSGFTIRNAQIGIHLNQSSYTVIRENNLTQNSWGNILLDYSSNNSINENNATNSWFCIVIRHSSNNSFVKNSITNNFHGFQSSNSANNSFIGNTITSNKGKGISLTNSSNNTLIRNTITESDQDGIFFSYSSNNVVAENNVLNNACGIYFWESSNNTIYHNNFANQVCEAHIYSPNAYLENVWDDGYPSGGNYWNDYNRPDLHGSIYQNTTESDAIGDVPYKIEGDTQDNYPLKGMFSNFEATPTQNVQVICNSSIASFHYNGTTINFKVSGENGTSGFCRICIPTALMSGVYKVFVNDTELTYTLLACSNSTHSYLYFTYDYSTQEIIIIPEFSSFLVLQIFITGTLVAIIVCKKEPLYKVDA